MSERKPGWLVRPLPRYTKRNGRKKPFPQDGSVACVVGGGLAMYKGGVWMPFKLIWGVEEGKK